jgi:inorganic pyrophosphatase
MHVWHDLSLGENAPDEVTVVIEIPRGSQNKYEVDKETGLVKLDRVLWTANFYPFDYGFLPQTLWEDGDPLDVMVVATNPLVPGCLVDCRPIGVMRMMDSGESDDKLICVPTADPRFASINALDDLQEHMQKEWKQMFETMKMLQGKEVKVTGFEDAKAAKETIKKSVELYNEKFSK